MKVRQALILSLALSSFYVTSHAQKAAANPQQPDLTAAMKQLAEARTTLSDGSLAEAQTLFESCVKVAPQDARCEFGLARVAYYRAFSAEMRGDKQDVQQWADAGIAHAQRTVALNEKWAEAHSLLADLYAKKITGMLSGPKFGPKVTAENQRALALDPNSAMVQASVGREYMFKPKGFGGDINKAIGAFHTSVQLDPNADESWVWLGLALRKKGDAQGADHAISKALTLNPRSVFAQRAKSGNVTF